MARYHLFVHQILKTFSRSSGLGLDCTWYKFKLRRGCFSTLMIGIMTGVHGLVDSEHYFSQYGTLVTDFGKWYSSITGHVKSKFYSSY